MGINFWKIFYKTLYDYEQTKPARVIRYLPYVLDLNNANDERDVSGRKTGNSGQRKSYRNRF